MRFLKTFSPPPQEASSVSGFGISLLRHVSVNSMMLSSGSPSEARSAPLADPLCWQRSDIPVVMDRRTSLYIHLRAGCLVKPQRSQVTRLCHRTPHTGELTADACCQQWSIWPLRVPRRSLKMCRNQQEDHSKCGNFCSSSHKSVDQKVTDKNKGVFNSSDC